MGERSFTWDDPAQVMVWPPEHPAPNHVGSLASCVRFALEIAELDRPPAKVEIQHDSPRLIEWAEIERLATDLTFPAAMRPRPRLFRRNDVPDWQWVAFAYGPSWRRQTAFVTYDALHALADKPASPETMFDTHVAQILRLAVGKMKSGKRDQEGRVVIAPDDLLDVDHSTAHQPHG